MLALSNALKTVVPQIFGLPARPKCGTEFLEFQLRVAAIAPKLLFVRFSKREASAFMALIASYGLRHP
jgi:hypothetical protein